MDTDHGGKRAADEEKERYRRQIKQRDALVVRGQQPRSNPVGCIQVVLVGQLIANGGWYRTHGCFFPVGANPAPASGGDCKDFT